VSDPRQTPMNSRVAHLSLGGIVDHRNFVEGTLMRTALSVADLLREPGGARDKQLTRGQGFHVLDLHQGYAFGFDPHDHYVGYVAETALATGGQPTHRVVSRATHAYAAPDIKSPERAPLYFLSELVIVDQVSNFARLDDDTFVPANQLQPLSWRAGDPVKVAEQFLGAPYLWGGDTSAGLDCSALVQRSAWAAGRTCPRDSDQQLSTLGNDAALDAPAKRGDLFFWKGHLAIAQNADTLIHANAHHMSVVEEDITAAITRIAAQGGGPVIGRGSI
jgi:hypothetical protein